MKKILIVNPFGIGDVLFATPVISALRRKFPDSFIGFICNRNTAPVLQNNPAVNELFFYSRGDLKRIKQKSRVDYCKHLGAIIKKLRSLKIDCAVDLSLVNQYSFILWMIGVRQRWGFDYKGRGFFLNHKILLEGFKDRHVVDYYNDLLKKMGVDTFERKLDFFLGNDDVQWAGTFLRGAAVADNEQLIGVVPFGGASWGKDAKSKQWPLERFAAVVKALIKRYPVKVILFGAGEHTAQAQELKERIADDRAINAAGKTTLGQLAALIKRCKLFIGNDSGPLHIACALNVKTVSIFGPVDETVYGPVGKSGMHRTVSKPLSCRPCYRNFRKTDCQSIRCLLDITEHDVMQAVEEMV